MDFFSLAVRAAADNHPSAVVAVDIVVVVDTAVVVAVASAS